MSGLNLTNIYLGILPEGHAREHRGIYVVGGRRSMEAIDFPPPGGDIHPETDIPAAGMGDPPTCSAHLWRITAGFLCLTKDECPFSVQRCHVCGHFVGIRGEGRDRKRKPQIPDLKRLAAEL